MYSLAYNANGLRSQTIENAITMVAANGYKCIELSLHRNHIHPLDYTEEQIDRIKNALADNHVQPVCLATGAQDLLSDDPYEPSLIAPEKEGRVQRIELIKASINIARKIGISIVNIASGFLREEVEQDDAYNYLVEGIKECLEYAADDIILAIEPEPGMYIQTSSDAKKLVEDIGNSNFRINLDIGHVECCETDIYESIKNVIDLTAHIHIEDIKNKIHFHEIPGEGNLDFYKILELLKRSNYNGAISVELYHHDSVARKALKDSYQYLTNIIDSL